MATIVSRFDFLRPKTFAARRDLYGYLFISPFVLGILLFFLVPAAIAVWLSFTDWNLLRPPNFIGLANFERLFRDELVGQALKVTFNFAIVSVPLSLALSFVLALLINTKVRGIAFFRTIYYMPTIVPAVANAVLWGWILNTEFGLLNAILRELGLPKIKWLQDPAYAMPALVLMSLWTVGGSMVIFLAGLQGIPDVYYEATEIDGAGTWAKLRNITVPLMSPVIFFNLIMGIIASLQTFVAGFLITNGGPANATLFYVLHLYRTGFRYFEMGYAATMAWVLFAVILVLTLFTFRYVERTVHYEDQR